jgi:hypothetical protein
MVAHCDVGYEGKEYEGLKRKTNLDLQSGFMFFASPENGGKASILTERFTFRHF